MREEFRIRVDRRGRVVIPASCRKSLGLENGGKAIFSMKDGELRVVFRSRKKAGVTQPKRSPIPAR